jgi:hypothetical protein
VLNAVRGGLSLKRQIAAAGRMMNLILQIMGLDDLGHYLHMLLKAKFLDPQEEATTSQTASLAASKEYEGTISPFASCST